MTKATRVKLFLTEYKALCEKYNLYFKEGMISADNNAVIKANHIASTIDLMDSTEGEHDVYFISSYAYPETGIKGGYVKVLVDDEVVEPYESMPEITKGFIGKSQKTDEEIREELAADGVFI